MKTTQVVIILEGGLIQRVISDKPVEYARIDLDTEDCGDETLWIVNDDNVEVNIFKYRELIKKAELDPGRVAHYFAEVKNEDH